MADIVLAKMAVQIAANTAEFNQALGRAESNFKNFTGSITKLAGAAGLSFGLFQVGGIFKDAISSIAEFESKLSTVKAITGATDREFELLRESALKLGASTKFTAAQVADLQTEFGRIGFSTSEILAATKATLLLATATGEDLAKSADVAGSTVRGFGLDAAETGRVVDVMAESFNATALSLENFREAMKYVAPVAAQAGISLEETTALLGTLADAGIRGSMAGTSLRKIITDLGGESGTLSEKLQKLAAKGLSGADAMDEVGRTAYASLLILANATEKTDGLTKSFQSAAGAAQKAADIMSDNLTGDVVKLTSAYDGLVQSAGSSTSILREFVQAGTSVIQSLNAQNGALGEFISGWVKLALIVPRSIASVVKDVADMFSGVGKQTDRQVQQSLRYFKTLRDNAIADGDQEAVIKYTKAIAELSSMYGLITDKAVEFGNGVPTDKIEESAGLIETLEQQIADTEKALKKAFSVSEIRKFQKEIDTLHGKLFDLLNPTTKRKTNILDLQADTGYGLFSDPDLKTKFAEAFKVPAIDTSSFNDSIQKFIGSLKGTGETLRDDLIDIGPMIASGVSSIADALGNAFGSGNFKDLGKGLLEAFASFAQQLGSLMIASGIAETVLQTGSPQARIVAGAVLVAAGAAIKATLAKKKSFPKMNGSAGSGGYSPGSSSLSGVAQNSEPLQVEISGVLKGQDIWLSMKNYENGKKFTSANG